VKRVVIPELLDSDAGSPREIERSLSDLSRINRWFGGVRTLRQSIENVASRTGRTDFTALDVGAGSGEVPRIAAHQLARRGIRVSFVLSDRAVTHLQRASAGAARVVGDALQLPFADRSFDLVTCSLFLHHLEPDEVRTFIADASRVARVALLINDVRRHWLHLLLTYLALPLFRSRLTWHDAPASVRRAYTPAEILRIAYTTPPSIDAASFTNYLLFRTSLCVDPNAVRELQETMCNAPAVNHVGGDA
jgi:ubiquinone/menaquinone biosynthesis C-methylase UbiE